MRTGLCSRPRPDRWADRPIPLLGGLPILLAVSLAAWISGDGKEQTPRLAGAWTAFLVGLRDDAAAMGPIGKMAGVFGACLVEETVRMAMAGSDTAGGKARSLGASRGRATRAAHGVLDIAFVVAATNAFNMVDNMDAVAAGLASISAGGILDDLSERHAPDASDGGRRLAGGTLGACCGFLAWNAPTSSLMMGDAGSMSLGYLLSRAALETGDGWCRMLRPSLLLFVPAADTLFVLVRRATAGRSLVRGNTDHASHALAGLGLPEPGPAAVLWGLHAAGMALRGHRDRSTRYVEFAAAAVAGVLIGRMISGTRVIPRSPFDSA
jgi:UDP-N-acetylmuramyl pentapeptide phosphotransferase/UDP-N-acetylglucosamine-1-phosphate transferase